MKKLYEPLNVFDLKPPIYKEINSSQVDLLVRMTKLSIIILKRCSILRTFIYKIMSHCWREPKFLSCWKHAFTILIHKKGSNVESSKLRPITLQPVFAKIYSSLIRNRIYNFFLENQFTESNMQKGFWRAISGKIEHNRTANPYHQTRQK